MNTTELDAIKARLATYDQPANALSKMVDEGKFIHKDEAELRRKMAVAALALAEHAPDDIRALLSRVETLEAALRFYTDPDKYENYPYEEADIISDGGALARRALDGELWRHSNT